MSAPEEFSLKQRMEGLKWIPVTDEQMAAMFEAAKPVFKTMKEADAAVMKITPSIGGKKIFSVILVCGDEEVRAVVNAVEEIEKKWGGEEFEAQKTQNEPKQ